MPKSIFIIALIITLVGCDSTAKKSNISLIEKETLQAVNVEYELSTGATTIYISKILYAKDSNELLVLVKTKDSPMGHAAFHTATDSAEVLAPANAKIRVYVVDDERFKQNPNNQERGYQYIKEEASIGSSISDAVTLFESDS